MEVSAKTRYVRISPRKVRAVADLVRGRNAREAEASLRFVPNRPAGVIRKLIRSAIANAEQKGDIDVDNLFVKRINVDAGPTMKRYLPRSMGRANVILKRMSHISVVLEEK